MSRTYLRVDFHDSAESASEAEAATVQERRRRREEILEVG